VIGPTIGTHLACCVFLPLAPDIVTAIINGKHPVCTENLDPGVVVMKSAKDCV
jgi:hypothetical protein